MKNYLALLMGMLVLGSCKQQPPKAEETTAEPGIVYQEYQGEEPTRPEQTEVYEPKPPKVEPYGQNGVPSDAIVLFDGSGFDEWVMSKDSTEVVWHLNDDGSMTVNDKTGDIQTKRNFGSVQLHLEWRSPAEVERDGQNRGNSGVFLNNLYEVQVLDNNDNATYVNGQVASIYKQHVPLAMASVASGDWNTYDIIYHQPEFNEAGNKIKSGTLTVIHNGVLVQDHAEIKGTTPYIGWPKNPAHGDGPIRLQDHGDNSRVSYRNIWLREL
ncbi:3-keto-disaccharide hydrolase [Robiginitalea sp. IMCC44478]|uniref:3-keto-disaccharide hydrolase n=1 Tax=Robiginitalea sp. IMCC44478 TaxID=3459122 RepID=UPI004042665A